VKYGHGGGEIVTTKGVKPAQMGGGGTSREVMVRDAVQESGEKETHEPGKSSHRERGRTVSGLKNLWPGRESLLFHWGAIGKGQQGKGEEAELIRLDVGTKRRFGKKVLSPQSRLGPGRNWVLRGTDASVGKRKSCGFKMHVERKKGSGVNK